MVRTWHYHCWGPGSIPGQGTKVLQASQHSKKKNELSGFYDATWPFRCLLSHSHEASKSVGATESRTSIKVLQAMTSFYLALPRVYQGGGGLVAKLCPILATPCQAPLSMGFAKPEYWSGLPLPSPGNLPNPGIEPRSPALQADSLPIEL